MTKVKNFTPLGIDTRTPGILLIAADREDMPTDGRAGKDEVSGRGQQRQYHGGSRHTGQPTICQPTKLRWCLANAAIRIEEYHALQDAKKSECQNQRMDPEPIIEQAGDRAGTGANNECHRDRCDKPLGPSRCEVAAEHDNKAE